MTIEWIQESSGGFLGASPELILKKNHDYSMIWLMSKPCSQVPSETEIADTFSKLGFTDRGWPNTVPVVTRMSQSTFCLIYVKGRWTGANNMQIGGPALMPSAEAVAVAVGDDTAGVVLYGHPLLGDLPAGIMGTPLQTEVTAVVAATMRSGPDEDLVCQVVNKVKDSGHDAFAQQIINWSGVTCSGSEAPVVSAIPPMPGVPTELANKAGLAIAQAAAACPQLAVPGGPLADAATAFAIFAAATVAAGGDPQVNLDALHETLDRLCPTWRDKPPGSPPADPPPTLPNDVMGISDLLTKLEELLKSGVDLAKLPDLAKTADDLGLTKLAKVIIDYAKEKNVPIPPDQQPPPTGVSQPTTTKKKKSNAGVVLALAAVGIGIAIAVSTVG